MASQIDENYMWQQESGIIEMLFTYLGKYEKFSGWTNWRNILIDILTCHEEINQQRTVSASDIAFKDVNNTKIETEGRSDFHAVKGSVANSDNQSSSVAESIGALPQFWNPFGDQEDRLQGDHTTSFYDADDPDKSRIAVKVENIDDCEEAVLSSYEREQMQMVESANERSQIYNVHSDGEIMQKCDVTTEIFSHLTTTSPISSSNEFGSCDLRCSNVNKQRFLSTTQQPSQSALENVCDDASLTTFPFEMKEIEKRNAKRKKCFVCRYCGKIFNDCSNKLRHERIHTQDRRFHCRFCGKSFLRNAHRLDHERIHSRDLPLNSLTSYKQTVGFPAIHDQQ